MEDLAWDAVVCLAEDTAPALPSQPYRFESLVVVRPSKVRRPRRWLMNAEPSRVARGPAGRLQRWCLCTHWTSSARVRPRVSKCPFVSELWSGCRTATTTHRPEFPVESAVWSKDDSFLVIGDRCGMHDGLLRDV